MLPEFDDVWFINGDSEEGLVPLSLWELLLDGVWLLFVLSHLNLGGDNVRNLLDDGVVNSLGNFIGNLEVFFIWDLVVDGVRNLLGDNIWYLLGDSVGHLSAGDVWDLELDLIWHLSLNSVWNFSGDFIWLKGLDLVLLSDVFSFCDLVWNGVDLNIGNLLGDLVFLSDVLGNIVVMFIGG